ncbi:MAG: DUF4340 domain-containing protein [Paraglaciecola sp.]|uniref:DUF4340 domain-containing protein n=1 Tax=Paraglaciecola sp. TaxID=1920173 RepID=UPI003297E917
MNKSFWFLVLFVVAALAGGLWLFQEPVEQNKRSEPIFKDFRRTVDTLQSVTITNAQGTLFEADNENGVWLASVKAGQPKYPVAKQHLADLLQTLTQAKLLEAKTRKAENFSQLGLQALYAQDSIASLITLESSSSSKSLMVGKVATSGHGSFIRKPSEAQTWLADRYIEVPVDKFAWLQQPILPYQAEDIVSISRVDHDSWNIVRDPQNTGFKLSDISQRSELKYDAILKSIIVSITDLKFERLLEKENELLDSLEVLTELEILAVENVSLRLVVGKIKEQHFVYLSTTDENPYWSNWIYQISSFSAQQLVKSMSDFIKDKPSSETGSDSTFMQFSIDEGESPN